MTFGSHDVLRPLRSEPARLLFSLDVNFSFREVPPPWGWRGCAFVKWHKAVVSPAFEYTPSIINFRSDPKGSIPFPRSLTSCGSPNSHYLHGPMPTKTFWRKGDGAALTIRLPHQCGRISRRCTTAGLTLYVHIPSRLHLMLVVNFVHIIGSWTAL